MQPPSRNVPRARLAMLLAAVLAAALTAALTAPVLGAKPTRQVIDIGTPEDEAAVGDFYSELCGFTINADLVSTVTVHVFTDRHGEFKREIDKYLSWDTLINPATGESVTLRDIGPDIFWINRDGEVVLAQIGRSLTGSGYIGRVATNLDTGEQLRVAGKSVGSLEDQVCDPLAE
jgi:hypothetical protein